MRYALALVFAVGMTNAACGCSLTPCLDRRPQTPFDLPSCSEYNLNSTFIRALEGGDRGAVAVLRQRYRDAETFGERNRIGGALIKAHEDSGIWAELFARSEDAVRLAPGNENQPNAELAKWCKERGWEPNEYWNSLYDSYRVVIDDPRALPLLRRALESPNSDVADEAVIELAFSKERDALAQIDEIFRKRETPPTWLVMMLAYLHTDAADAVAMKYLKDDKSVAEYRKAREQPE